MFEHCLYFNSTALARVVEKTWKKAFSSFDLTPPQAFCLRAVIVKPGAKPSELAETLGIARATTTRLLDHLERKKLIERRLAKADNRESMVLPTAKAKALAQEIESASAQMTTSMKATLGAQQFAGAVEKLRSTRKDLC